MQNKSAPVKGINSMWKLGNARYRRYMGLLPLSALLFLAACDLASGNKSAAKASVGKRGVESLIPSDKLAKIKSSLPKVASPNVQGIFQSENTLWYDHDVMTPSYQDSLGANSNAHWPDLVAAPESIIGGLHDRERGRWQFPFATTAGTDNATNLQVEDFVSFPQIDGAPATIPYWTVTKNDNRSEWMWMYPIHTTFGECLFITDGDTLLPVEIRIRTRYADGWAMNVFRPFPTAKSLSDEIKRHRPDWARNQSLAAAVAHLEDNTTLTAKSMAGQGVMASSFSQDGWMDTLPDLDAQLVRELLTSTPFKTAYETTWKENGSQKAYAPTTTNELSIVPTNFDAGLIQVNEKSCMRCHQETGRLVSDFYFELLLYGELWGKDGIFSFHPYDESLYGQLRAGGDNRQVNPALQSLFVPYDSNTHTAPRYPETLVGQ